MFTSIPVIYMITRDSPLVLAEVFNDPSVRGAILTSLQTATITALFALVFGVPLAYLLAFCDFPGKKLITALMQVPILLPHTVAGICLLSLFGPRGPIGTPLAQFGVQITDTFIGVVAAQLFVSSPLLILTVRETFDMTDPSLEGVARTLGASKAKAFFTVVLPSVYGGIAAGVIQTWARALSEFGAVMIIAYYPHVAPILIYKRFVEGGLSHSRPAATLLVLITLSIFVCLEVTRLSTINGRKRKK